MKKLNELLNIDKNDYKKYKIHLAWGGDPKDRLEALREYQKDKFKANKYLKEYLDLDVWTRLMNTFNMGNYDSSWNALITTCELFAEIVPKVGKIFEYEYNYDEAKRSFAFIKHIKELPKTATKIY